VEFGTQREICLCHPRRRFPGPHPPLFSQRGYRGLSSPVGVKFPKIGKKDIGGEESGRIRWGEVLSSRLGKIYPRFRSLLHPNTEGASKIPQARGASNLRWLPKGESDAFSCKPNAGTGAPGTQSRGIVQRGPFWCGRVCSQFAIEDVPKPTACEGTREKAREDWCRITKNGLLYLGKR